MILIFILFVLLSLYLALKKPTLFVIYYVIVSTKFLGFFDINDYFILSGLALGFPLINVITFISVFWNSKRYLWTKKSLAFVSIIMLFLISGILYPYVMGYSSLLDALIESKEFWTISLFIYLYTFRRSIVVEQIMRFMLWLGLYLSMIYIVYYILNLAPPSYVEYKVGIGNYVRAYFPTYISLAFFINYVKKSSNKILKYFILTVGLFLSGHLSLVIGIVFSFGLLSILRGNRWNYNKLIYTSLALIIAIITILPNFKTIENFTNEIVYAGRLSIKSRKNYNQFRWKAISASPLFGYGFIRQTASYMKKLNNNENSPYSERLGVIDSGYVDLLVKFGYIGTIIYLLTWLLLIYPFLFKPGNYTPLKIALASYIAQYFLVDYTLSVFTYSVGLIPAFICVFILLKKN